MKYNISDLTKQELVFLIESLLEKPDKNLFVQADEIRRKHYGNSVFARGLIEISNHCKAGCHYCGINRTNRAIRRFHLSKDEILERCADGYDLGFRTFVLQGGEDSFYNDDYMCGIIYEIRNNYPDCAITLSVGEKSYATYKRYFDSGANRYLLRHETANPEHFALLHPKNQKFEIRIQCLYDLKEIGFQVGSGFMVGSPFQKIEYLAEDLLFLKELQPHMVGIGPFIPQKDTVFKSYEHGKLDLTLIMISLTRLLLPKALIPSTTALGSISEDGRRLGIMSGANVVMPNLSPKETRVLYNLYDNKVHSGSDAAEGLDILRASIESAGYKLDMSRGDWRE